MWQLQELKGALSNNLVYKTPFNQSGEGNSKWHPSLTHFVLCPNEYKKKYFACRLSSALDMVNLAVCTYTLSVAVLTWWVAPPKMFCNWYRI